MSVLGWVLGIALLFVGIVLNKMGAGTPEDPIHYVWIFDYLKNFWDPTSVAIVVGGSFSALMVSFPLKAFTKIPKHLKIVLFPTKYNPQSYIEQLVSFAKEARINGLLALEDKLSETEDQFMKSSLMMVIDSVDAEKVKVLLETELDYLDDRHAQDRAFYDKAASYGPAFGMIGTLIGLINLLKQLDDPNSIGPAMAVALITTFYGTVLANMIFTPISNKLKVRHEEEYLCKMIISEGVQAIQAGDNPKFIEEKLTQLLPSFLISKSGLGSEDEGGGKGGKKAKAPKPKKEKAKK